MLYYYNYFIFIFNLVIKRKQLYKHSMLITQKKIYFHIIYKLMKLPILNFKTVT